MPKLYQCRKCKAFYLHDQGYWHDVFICLNKTSGSGNDAEKGATVPTGCLEMRRQPMRLKSSSQGPSLVLVGLSLLCAGWLLGYGLALSNETLTKFVVPSTSVRLYSHALPSWKGVPMTKKTDSVP